METNLAYRDFQASYKGNRILVRIEADEGERLFINGILHDQNMGSESQLLTGYLYGGNTIMYKIEVRLTKEEKLGCAIYVNEEIIYSNLHSEELEEKKMEKGRRDYELNRRMNRRTFLFLGIVSAFIIVLKLFSTAGMFE